MKANPFFELYVGDRISSSEFVTIFSPELVPHTEALFLPGNIVVTGIQGCGKSMLLSLLKPRVRMEYFAAEQEFPVPLPLRKFICSSVNLAHSSVIDFGYRDAIDEDVQKTELYFGDFLNYLLCDSLLDSIEIYLDAPEEIRNEIGLKADREELDALCHGISALDVWEGWIGPCNSIQELRDRLKARAKVYRRYVHGKDRELPARFFDTLTPVGAPLLELSGFLKRSNAVAADTNFFADIDQYEELGNISSRNTPGKNVDYRAVINKAMASRNPAVSYRIGTRGYSWKRHGKIHGTSGNLEHMRDYKYIDLDQILKRDEDDSARGDNVFDSFAEDVFYRRLKYADFDLSGATAKTVFQKVYGAQVTPENKVNRDMGLREPEKYIDLDASWSKTTREALLKLADKDLFSAKLGEYWVRQKGEAVDLTVRDEQLPWMRNSARWWRKERRHVIPVVIASASRQKAIWGGAKEILELSGGSILAFLGINQFIWSTWLQRNDRPESIRAKLPEIDVGVQSSAILRASNSWFEMIYQQSARSSERAKFVKIVGDALRNKLLGDKRMSYPGANGFSVPNEDLDQFPRIKEFLEQLADYGNVLMLPHTSKNAKDVSRTKFYFHPVFCPHLGIPYVRTKEPYYTRAREVAEWVYKSGFDAPLSRENEIKQQSLF